MGQACLGSNTYLNTEELDLDVEQAGLGYSTINESLSCSTHQ